MTDSFDTTDGRRIAYSRSSGGDPGIVFLGGFRSDMTGTKAIGLEAWAQARGQAYLRFDYSGHGASSGKFEDSAIGDWLADARAAVLSLTEGRQILVGSSMGGWIALLLARSMPDRIAGLVTIAAAPDFTEDFWAALSREERDALLRDGALRQPSDYSDEPYIFTRRLIEEARDHLILTEPLSLPMPVRMLQGTVDTDVPVTTALRLLDHSEGPDIRLTLVKGADHRFSTPDCIEAIRDALADVLERV